MKNLNILSCFALLFILGCQNINSQSAQNEITPIKSSEVTINFDLKPGDLLFQDSDCGSFCDAIEKVTFGVNGGKFSHVGMVVRNDSTGQLVVLEAISEGVVETNFDSFFDRSYDENDQPKVVVGRIKPEFEYLVKPAIKEGKSLIGKPYDEYFDINNDAYYCSELIYQSFKKANNGQAIFQLRPMTYIDPSTEKTFDIWVDYFKELGYPIPEKKPGLNPGGMSKSIYLDIVHVFGKPTGWRAQNN
jgi:uncharacterized protein YycO